VNIAGTTTILIHWHWLRAERAALFKSSTGMGQFDHEVEEG
jgi:hypothetical protein